MERVLWACTEVRTNRHPTYIYIEKERNDMLGDGLVRDCARYDDSGRSVVDFFGIDGDLNYNTILEL